MSEKKKKYYAVFLLGPQWGCSGLSQLHMGKVRTWMSPAHCRAFCKHLGIPYFAQECLGSAMKVSWHLPLQPENPSFFFFPHRGLNWNPDTELPYSWYINRNDIFLWYSLINLYYLFTNRNYEAKNKTLTGKYEQRVTSCGQLNNCICHPHRQGAMLEPRRDLFSLLVGRGRLSFSSGCRLFVWQVVSFPAFMIFSNLKQSACLSRVIILTSGYIDQPIYRANLCGVMFLIWPTLKQ